MEGGGRYGSCIQHHHTIKRMHHSMDELWISVFVLVIMSVFRIEIAHSNHTRDGITGTKKGIGHCICLQPYSALIPNRKERP